MSAADDFLDTAKTLHRVGSHEGDWRRVISTAYYAAFHCIIENGSPLIFANQSAVEEGRRWFSHNGMYSVATTIGSKPNEQRGDAWLKWKKQCGAIGITELPGATVFSICRNFAHLKRSREKADYFPPVAESKFARSEAGRAVDLAQSICDDLPQLARGNPSPDLVAMVMAMLKKSTNLSRSRS